MKKGMYPHLNHHKNVAKYAELFQPSVCAKVSISRLLDWIDVVDFGDHLKFRNLQHKELREMLHAPASADVLRLIEETPADVQPIQKAIFAAMAWEHPYHVPIVEAFLDKLFASHPEKSEAALEEYLRTAPEIAAVHLPRIEGLCDDMSNQEQLALWLTLMNGSLQDIAQKKITALTKDGTFSALYVLGKGGHIPELSALCARLSKSLPKALGRLSTKALQATHQWYSLILASDETSDLLLV